MLEIKVTVLAPELTEAVNNLAAAISGKAPQKAAQSIPMNDAVNPMPAPQPSAPMPQPPITPVAPPLGSVSTPAPSNVAPMQPPVVPTQPAYPAAPAAPFPQQSVPTTPVAGVPLAGAPQYTVDQIMAAGATLMDAGKVNDLMNLLHSFGVQAVMDLKPEQLGAFATEMRKMGAAI